jgi:hypothetical protein
LPAEPRLTVTFKPLLPSVFDSAIWSIGPTLSPTSETCTEPAPVSFTVTVSPSTSLNTTGVGFALLTISIVAEERAPRTAPPVGFCRFTVAVLWPVTLLLISETEMLRCFTPMSNVSTPAVA